MAMSNNTSDDFWAEKLRRENCDQFNTLVRMHLSFVLDLHTDDYLNFVFPKNTEYQESFFYSNECQTEKTKFKKWSFVPFTKKPKCLNRGVMYGAPLTQEGICQVYQLIEFVGKEPNICAEGVFRRTGSITRQQELRSLLNQGQPLNLDSSSYSVHDCASVLKGFLAELPEPLLTDAHYPAHCQIAELCAAYDKQANETRLLRSLQLLLLLLPTENRVLLRDILLLLNQVSTYESQNKMNADSLATLFTPHLLCPRRLSPEALHVDSLTLKPIVAFMIRKGEDCFQVPPKLAVDIRAYFLEREKRQAAVSSPNESVGDNVAASTVFSFVDRERTAQAHVSNPTEAALAQLYAYIQGLPESAKKRKLVKQFNRENGNGTPLQVQRTQQKGPKSLGDSIKKHIFQKGANKTIKRSTTSQNNAAGSLASTLKTTCDDALNSPNCVPIGPRTKLFCVDCESSSDSDQEAIPLLLSFNDEAKGTNDAMAESDDEIVVKRSLEVGLDVANDVSQATRCFSEPDLSSDAGERYWPSYLTSTPAGLPLRHNRDVTFTPINHGRKSMSPITRSTQRMSKAMQESMMTPRSRKPVLLMSGTNICNLPKVDLMKRSSSICSLPEDRTEEERMEVDESQDRLEDKKPGDESLSGVISSLEGNKTGDESFSEGINSPLSRSQSVPTNLASRSSRSSLGEINPDDSLTSTFREYLCSRSILTASPGDASFSSRTDDYDSHGDDLSDSLLFCLDGNIPNPDVENKENSANDSNFIKTSVLRKRSNSNEYRLNEECAPRKRSNISDCDLKDKTFDAEKELVLKPKQFNANGEPIVFETSF